MVVGVLRVQSQIGSFKPFHYRRLNDSVLCATDTELKNTSFDFLDSIPDANGRWLVSKNSLMKVVDMLAPKIKFRRKDSNLPWLDASTFKLGYYRDNL